MPSFEFTSPEGKTYQVEGPEGATKEQAFSILQQHQGISQKNGADNGEPKSPSLLSQAMKPIRDIPTDIGQEFGAGSKQISQTYQRSMEALAKGESKPAGTALNYLSGGLQELFSPITGTATAIVGDPLRKNLPDNAAGKIAANTAEDLAAMAGPGAVARSAGSIAKMMPGLNSSVQKLLDAGIQLTPGQIAQSMFKQAEDSLAKVPVLGSFMAAGQRRSILDFNKAIINQSLTPIGEKLPEDLRAGRKAIAYAENKIGSAYDKLLPKLNFQADAQLSQDVTDIAKTNQRRLSESHQKQFSASLMYALDHMDPQTASMDGQSFKQVESELSALARANFRSQDPKDHQFAQAINELNSAFRENLERGNPKYAGDLKNLNTAWATFARAQGASIRRPKAEGIFSPADLLQDIKSSTSKGVFARGDGMLQDLAEAGNSVLPSTVPSSGTVMSGIWGALAGSGLGAEGLIPHVTPGMVAGYGASALPYTKPGMKAVNALARGGPQQAASQALQSPATAVLSTLGQEQGQQ
jgi:hypothetical protein